MSEPFLDSEFSEYHDDLVRRLKQENVRLKGLLREYRHPKNLRDVHIACYNGPSDARGELGCGWDDNRCDLCKRTDKELGQ